MENGKNVKYKSWLLSGGIIIAVVLWLTSGQFGKSDEAESLSSGEAATVTASRNAVRVREQSAEIVLRTITVNGKTAPARVVELSAETDGRIEATVADRQAKTTVDVDDVRGDMTVAFRPSIMTSANVRETVKSRRYGRR